MVCRRGKRSIEKGNGSAEEGRGLQKRLEWFAEWGDPQKREESFAEEGRGLQKRGVVRKREWSNLQKGGKSPQKRGIGLHKRRE